MSNETVPQNVARRAAAASLVGTAVEWYDYFIFGSASALVFGKLFFPGTDPLIGTLSSFAVFGVGFLARPLGGVVFGHLGDKLGRKRALVSTLLIMGLATFLIGLLPTAQQIGIWAPLLLVLLRLLQGFGVGGEWGGAALVAVEYAPEGKRGRYGSFPQVGNAVGVVMSTGIFGLVAMLPDAQFESWGWRIPFLVSIVLIGVGLFVRFRLTETPAFRAAQEKAEVAASPVAETMRSHRRPLLMSILIRIGESVTGYIILAFALSYATTQVGVEKSTVLNATTVAAVIGIGTFYLAGVASDHFGRRPVFAFGAVVSALMAFPFFWLFDTGSTVAIFVAVILAYSIGVGAQYGVEPAFLSELFGTRVRYSGLSIGYQVSSLLGGGMVPFVATAMVGAAGGSAWPVSVYVILACGLSLVALYLTRETYQRDLTVDPTLQPKPDRTQLSTAARPTD